MEFFPDLSTEVCKILKNYNCFVEKGAIYKPMKNFDCQVIFTGKNLEILSSGRLDLYKNSLVTTGFASYVIVKKDGGNINVVNVHGKSIPGHKVDTPARIKQSKTIIEFLKDKNGLKIIGGDFNLMPDTKSVGMFEKAGYRNLIRDFNIQETRNRLSWEQFPDKERQHFADYVFVSKDAMVNKFEVPYNEISDHLPQILDFEI